MPRFHHWKPPRLRIAALHNVVGAFEALSGNARNMARDATGGETGRDPNRYPYRKLAGLFFSPPA
jgi:hypothetical protein